MTITKVSLFLFLLIKLAFGMEEQDIAKYEVFKTDGRAVQQKRNVEDIDEPQMYMEDVAEVKQDCISLARYDRFTYEFFTDCEDETLILWCMQKEKEKKKQRIFIEGMGKSISTERKIEMIKDLKTMKKKKIKSKREQIIKEREKAKQIEAENKRECQKYVKTLNLKFADTPEKFKITKYNVFKKPYTRKSYITNRRFSFKSSADYIIKIFYNEPTEGLIQFEVASNDIYTIIISDSDSNVTHSPIVRIFDSTMTKRFDKVFTKIHLCPIEGGKQFRDISPPFYLE